MIAGPDEQGLAQKIFGRNLDDFLATRLGAALAVVNLVLSIYAAIHASDPLERVADDLMATAAGLDLIAAVAGWALGAAGITTASVATICSAIGVLGILAALAGVAVLLYLVLRPRQNPVQQFTSTYAQPAGFYMQYGSAIDYFIGYTPGPDRSASAARSCSRVRRPSCRWRVMGPPSRPRRNPTATARSSSSRPEEPGSHGSSPWRPPVPVASSRPWC